VLGLQRVGPVGQRHDDRIGDPVDVIGISGATALAAGENHACALLAGGAVKCWGSNNFGALGNGTTVGISTLPVTVSGLSGATAIATGYSLSCAVVSGGGVRCWGSNSRGQLGNGTTGGSSNVPVAVTGLTGATGVAAGQLHVCALVAGTVECWGDNATGELGNGTYTSSPTPVVVTGITTASVLASGYFHACAIVADRSTLCWGQNRSGQLGDGSGSTRSKPTTVSKS